MAVMSGCGEKDQITKAERLLEEKYGEPFVIDDIRGQQMLGKYYTVIGHSEAYPTLIFSAGIGLEDDSISDSYVCERLMARMCDDMSRSTGRLKGECYLFAQGFIQNTNLGDPEMTLDAFMTEIPQQSFTFYFNYIPTGGESAEEIYEGISSMVSRIPSARGDVAVYICDSQTLFEIQSYVEKNDILYDDYDEIVEGRYAGKIQYADGVVVSSKEEFAEMAGKLL